jgi:hypothetical protein
MVNLEVKRESGVGEAFNEMELPQRSVPIEQRSVEPRDESKQLSDPARAR